MKMMKTMMAVAAFALAIGTARAENYELAQIKNYYSDAQCNIAQATSEARQPAMHAHAKHLLDIAQSEIDWIKAAVDRIGDRAWTMHDPADEQVWNEACRYDAGLQALVDQATVILEDEERGK